MRCRSFTRIVANQFSELTAAHISIGIADLDRYKPAGREAAKAMITEAAQAAGKPQVAITLGADKGYDVKEFIDALQAMKVTSHVAQNDRDFTM